jgi:hypothetical protein
MSNQNPHPLLSDDQVPPSRISIDFRHLLRDFIADLSDEEIARLAREIEG